MAVDEEIKATFEKVTKQGKYGQKDVTLRVSNTLLQVFR